MSLKYKMVEAFCGEGQLCCPHILKPKDYAGGKCTLCDRP